MSLDEVALVEGGWSTIDPLVLKSGAVYPPNRRC